MEQDGFVLNNIIINNMITIKQQFTFPENDIKGFAIFLGWREGDAMTFVEYVEEKALLHTLRFTNSWGEHIKRENIESQLMDLRTQLEPILEAQIITPIKNALTSEVIIN